MEPMTFGAVIFLLVGVSLAACFIPARRAMRVDPAEALRLD
jgi:putative ABC transport system permease protein